MRKPEINISFNQSISIELLALYERLNDIIDKKNKSPEICQDLCDKIDWIIIRLAQYTLTLNTKEPKYISRLKGYTWNLLERLEEYCINEIGISIW